MGSCQPSAVFCLNLFLSSCKSVIINCEGSARSVFELIIILNLPWEKAVGRDVTMVRHTLLREKLQLLFS